jgi:hypothetical protein
VPDKAEQLNRYASIRTAERLRGLLAGAGFTQVKVGGETRTFRFSSFDDYFSGIEAGAGLSGQEYVRLSTALQRTVREAVRVSFPDEGRSQPFSVEMEVLMGSGKAGSS